MPAELQRPCVGSSIFLPFLFYFFFEIYIYCIQEQVLLSFCNSKSGKDYYQFIPLSQFKEGAAGTAWFNYYIHSVPWTSELLAGGAWRLVDWVLGHLQYKHFSHWQLIAASPALWKEKTFSLSPENEGPIRYPYIWGLSLGRLRSSSLSHLSPCLQSIITAFQPLQTSGFLWNKWLSG